MCKEIVADYFCKDFCAIKLTVENQMLYIFNMRVQWSGKSKAVW